MKEDQKPETFCPAGKQQWREWLALNHSAKTSVWLVYYKKSTGRPSLTWSEAVDEALCFGWIDSTAKSMDEARYMQFFCRRKPASVWSKINKAKVEKLIAGGLMTTAGYASIEVAKQNGSWTILDGVEEMIVPPDLAKAFKKSKRAKAYYESLSPWVRKSILQKLVLAKRPETRQKRIAELVALSRKKV